MSREVFKQLQMSMREKRLSDISSERPSIHRTPYAKQDEIDSLRQVVEDLETELRESISKTVKQSKSIDIMLPVQRSVSIPVKIDEGGTGSTTLAGAQSALGIGSTTLYLGDSSTDGSWRLTVSGSDLAVQRREASVWVEKGSFLAS